VAACATECQSKVGTDAAWAGAYTCMQESCNAEACLAGPAAPSATCDAACAKLAECDLLVLIEFPEDQPEICRGACAGVVQGDPQLGAVVGCLAQNINECTDAPAALQTCADAGIGCDEMCDSIFEDIADECGQQAPIYGVWPDASACVTACEGLESRQQRAMFGCAVSESCEDPTLCLSAPTEPSAGCVATCGAAVETCGADLPFPDQGFCADMCTGMGHRAGVATDSPNAAQCFADAPTCGAEGGAAFANILGCAVESPEQCAGLCGRLTECGSELAETCLFGCAGAEREMPGVLDEIAACFDAAGEDCAAVEACVPGDDDEGEGDPGEGAGGQGG
jgi:hypothetical protein